MDKNNNGAVDAGILLDSAHQAQKEVADMEAGTKRGIHDGANSQSVQRVRVGRKQSYKEWNWRGICYYDKARIDRPRTYSPELLAWIKEERDKEEAKHGK
jgi:hypothetical protein